MPVPVATLDSLPADDAAALLRPCCASDRWVIEVLAARPVGSLVRLTEVSHTALAALDWPDVEQALAAHPRIGERREGADAEARWSRQEQSGAHAGADTVKAALVQGNLDYERQFGHVFLIRAAGRSAEDMLAALRERLVNVPGVERGVVRGQLAEIVQLRLATTFT